MPFVCHELAFRSTIKTALYEQNKVPAFKEAMERRATKHQSIITYYCFNMSHEINSCQQCFPRRAIARNLLHYICWHVQMALLLDIV